MKTRNSVSVGVRILAIATVALPFSVAFGAQGNAGQFFSQQQIVRQLSVHQGGNSGQFQGQFQGQRIKKHFDGEIAQGQFNGNGNVKFHKRAPMPQNDGAVIVGNNGVKTFRAPMPQNQDGNGQVIVGNNGVKAFRVPQPQNQDGNGQIIVGNNGVKAFRAPPPNNDDGGRIVQEFRAPAPKNGGAVAELRAPQANNDDVIVANNGNNGVEVRGLDVRRKTNNNEQVAVGQQIVSNDKSEVGTAYAGYGRIDLEILFDYDSDRINPASVKQLIALGEALNDPSLGKGRFVIAGHTDSAGSREYNYDLSQRRAHAVSEFLAYYAGVDLKRLVTEGYGEDMLKYPDAPESGQNRRVEIINLGEAG